VAHHQHGTGKHSGVPARFTDAAVVVRQRFPEDSSRASRVIEKTQNVLAELDPRAKPAAKPPSRR
jgi:hypothetical protein